ncbi:amino acid aminotransferase [Pseudodonghicola xiamenensis]|uniref:Aromatic amino acid aminotransferase n=1 Tax=Pseudodonghicola xiamenensis TaxID=337702 RepID=A0A8J3H6D1_9RHOB|nr:amino acid aminotransferase [Pseudodonghicola xiamenensis]GHG85070.1 aromatic amino acid aminotransferase [Pseudodonghicola xiamenensis]
MFETLKQQPADKILQLMLMYADDPRDQKIDLGVGVYKNADGITPVMRAVKAAEKRIWDEQTTKTYTGLTGDTAFTGGMVNLLLGDAVARDMISAVATTGGTGAVRLGFELIKMMNPKARIWVSDPTWPNHIAILNYLGIEIKTYRYFDPETRGVDFDAMIEDLKGAQAGDAVLLHGCCHNPTGANLNLVQWQEVADLLNDRGLLPMIDIAYQGFGDGLEEDAAGTRLVASSVPECLIASSCSKNFGIYRERTGMLMAISADISRRALVLDTMATLNRLAYSFPPDHGARIVSTILNDDALRADWMAELEDVRLSMLGLRQQLADELQRLTGSDRFAFLAGHRGMFSRLGVSPEIVERLRTDYGVYMVGDSRMNIAGLNSRTVPILAQAIVDAGA